MLHRFTPINCMVLRAVYSVSPWLHAGGLLFLMPLKCTKGLGKQVRMWFAACPLLLDAGGQHTS